MNAWHDCPPGLDPALWAAAVAEVARLCGEVLPSPEPAPEWCLDCGELLKSPTRPCPRCGLRYGQRRSHGLRLVDASEARLVGPGCRVERLPSPRSMVTVRR